MEFVRVSGIGAGTILCNGSMRVDVESLSDFHLLMFCTRGTAAVRVNGHDLQVGTQRGIVCAPGVRFRVDLSEDCDQFVLRLDRAIVVAHAGQPVVFDEVLDLQRPARAARLSHLGLRLASDALLDAVRSRPLLAAEMERLALHLLRGGQLWARGQTGPCDTPDTLASGWYGPCVKRAHSNMRSRLTDPLRLSVIATASVVSTRTLLGAFQRVRACSPMQRLHQMRLDMARRMLRDAQDDQTVASVALGRGFMHFGRYSHAYRQCFGESPSTTLRQGD